MEELLLDALIDYISVYPTGHFRYLEKYLCISSDIILKKFIKDIYYTDFYGSDIKDHHPLKIVILKEIHNRMNKQNEEKRNKDIKNSNLNAQASEYFPE